MDVRGYTFAVLVAALLSCQCGCGGKSVGDTAVGIYTLDIFSSPKLAALSPVARETLELKRDRTFSQEIVLRGGKNFRGTGKWRAEKIPKKNVGKGVWVADAVWVTLEGFMTVADGGVIRVTNSFHEAHQVGTDALFSYEGTNSQRFRRW